MNAGASLEQILAEVRPPAHLADRPYLQPVYDEPEFVVRNVWRLYGGWWDGVPWHLKPAAQSALGAEVAALAGGVGVLVGRAKALAARGDLVVASHLADWAVAAAPDDRDAHALRAAVYEARAQASAALMTRGIFAAAARVGRQGEGRLSRHRAAPGVSYTSGGGPSARARASIAGMLTSGTRKYAAPVIAAEIQTSVP
jgi:alkyl sulfatase BDS1-like metallo-beta-lactamase superfamily hydrolase